MTTIYDVNPFFYIENSSDGPIAGLATWHFLRQQVIWEKNMTHTPEYDGASVNSRKKNLNLFSPPFFYQNSRKKI